VGIKHRLHTSGHYGLDAGRGEKSVAGPDMQWSRLTSMPRERWQFTVIDGSSLSIADAGHLVLQWIRDAIAGRARVFRRDPHWAPGESDAHHRR
jgi:hypothetical protein